MVGPPAVIVGAAGKAFTVTTTSSVAVQLLTYCVGASVLQVAPLIVPLF